MPGAPIILNHHGCDLRGYYRSLSIRSGESRDRVRRLPACDDQKFDPGPERTRENRRVVEPGHIPQSGEGLRAKVLHVVLGLVRMSQAAPLPRNHCEAALRARRVCLELQADVLGTVRLFVRHDCLNPFLPGFLTEPRRLEPWNACDCRLTDTVRSCAVRLTYEQCKNQCVHLTFTPELTRISLSDRRIRAADFNPGGAQPAGAAGPPAAIVRRRHRAAARHMQPGALSVHPAD